MKSLLAQSVLLTLPNMNLKIILNRRAVEKPRCQKHLIKKKAEQKALYTYVYLVHHLP